MGPIKGCVGRVGSAWERIGDLRSHERLQVHRLGFVVCASAQIGICCGRRDEENPTRWLLHPYTFDAHPRESLEALQQRLQQNDWKTRSSDSSSHDGTAVNGCDPSTSQSVVGRAPETGEREKPSTAGSKQAPEDVADVAVQWRELKNAKAEEPSTSFKSSDDVGGLSVLAGALIEAGAPLVFHNGLLDLLHILEKFVEEVPPTLEAFAAERAELEAVADRLRWLKPAVLRMLLELLLPAARPCRCSETTCLPLLAFSELNVANELPEARSHEAGFDALATAQRVPFFAAGGAGRDWSGWSQARVPEASKLLAEGDEPIAFPAERKQQEQQQQQENRREKERLHRPRRNKTQNTQARQTLQRFLAVVRRP
ncbi:hypothetical protein ACSSS7_004283 [Eimeria intestinalis]